MSLSSELESTLCERVAEQILCEVERNVDALYQFIDPAIRESRVAKYSFEPEYTINQIREYTSRIESADVLSIAIDDYTDDGGAGRENAPTAIVLLTVRYNDRETPTDYRTPWVLRSGQWYTRATGKLTFPTAT